MQSFTICHIPHGHPENQQTITVDFHALQVHLRHGDHLGPCVEVTATPTASPTVSPTVSPSASPTVSPSPVVTATPIVTVSSSPSPSPSATISATPQPITSLPNAGANVLPWAIGIALVGAATAALLVKYRLLK